MAVEWAFRAGPSLRLPYQDDIAALLQRAELPARRWRRVFARYSSRLRLQYVRARSQGVAASTAFS